MLPVTNILAPYAVEIHLSGSWLSEWPIIRIGLVLRLKFVESYTKLSCPEITGRKDQVQRTVMASRTVNQAWSKGLDVGT